MWTETPETHLPNDVSHERSIQFLQPRALFVVHNYDNCLKWWNVWENINYAPSPINRVGVFKIFWTVWTKKTVPHNKNDPVRHIVHQQSTNKNKPSNELGPSSCIMLRSIARVPRQLPRRVKPLLSNPQLRQTATKATLGSEVAVQDSTDYRTLLATGLVAAAGAAGFLAYDQHKKSTDCCGIIGVVAHPKFDVR